MTRKIDLSPLSATRACRDLFGRMIAHVVLGDLDLKSWPLLRRHLSGCPRCRDQYNRAARAERLLEGGPVGQPSTGELARIEHELLDTQTNHKNKEEKN